MNYAPSIRLSSRHLVRTPAPLTILSHRLHLSARYGTKLVLPGVYNELEAVAGDLRQLASRKKAFQGIAGLFQAAMSWVGPKQWEGVTISFRNLPPAQSP